jgi:hypothetical protein
MTTFYNWVNIHYFSKFLPLTTDAMIFTAVRCERNFTSIGTLKQSKLFNSTFKYQTYIIAHLTKNCKIVSTNIMVRNYIRL